MDKIFTIEKVYLKDVSVECPNSPSKFFTNGQLEIDVNANTAVAKISDSHYEVVLNLKTNARDAEQVVHYNIEVQQAGIFRIEGLPEEELAVALQAACPNVLFPYARETVADLSAKTGFAPLLLQPMVFQPQVAEQAGEAEAPAA